MKLGCLTIFTKFYFLLFSGIIAISILLSSCNRGYKTKASSFLPYISAFSSGIISKTSSVKIELTGDLGLSHSLNSPLTEGLIKNDENLKGESFWSDAKTIVFKPLKDFPSGKQFHFHLNLGKIIKVPDSLKSFSFSVLTLKPNIEFESLGLKSFHNQKPRMVYEGIFTTADFESSAKAEEMLKINYEGSSPRISWVHSSLNRVHHFVIDSLMRGDKPKPLTINWNSGSIGKDSSGQMVLTVPGINEFKILETRAIQDSEQAVLLQFSDPISKTQDLRGLIELSTVTDLRFSLEGSEVKIYSGTILDGNFLLSIHTGIKNQDEKSIKASYSSNIFLENRSPSVSFPGNGVILPSSGKLMVPFISVNLKAVDLSILKIYTSNIPEFLQTESLKSPSYISDGLQRVGSPILQKTILLDEDHSLNLHHKNRFFLDLDKLIRTEPGAIYRILISFRKSYAVNVCAGTAPVKNGNPEENADESATNSDENSDNSNFDSDSKFWNFYTDGYRDGGEYDWNNRDNPCFKAYYTNTRWATRNILASNLGLIVKKQDPDKLWVSVNDLLNTDPISGVRLEVLDFQQQVIASGTSDSKGVCELNPRRKPFLLVAKRGNERAYLKISDENALSLSRFDIGGDIIQNGIKGFSYLERDVHRPGDSIFLSFILDDSQNKLPELFPVNFELRNPSGQLVKKVTLSKSIDKFYVFKTKTELDAPTGVYSVTIKVGSNSYTQEVRVETIMPNRLKISLDFGGLKQLSALDHNLASLSAKWLFGGIASKLKAKVDLNLLSTGVTSFAHFEDYIFDDPTVSFKGETKTIFEQSLNENGDAKIPLELNMGTHPPGKLKAQFLTKIFEPGGAFSINQTSIPLYFYSSFIGLKVPKGNAFDGGMLMTGKQNDLEIVQLDPKGNLILKPGKVELALYKLGWHWWWEKNTSVGEGFLQAKTTQFVKSQTLDLNGGKTHYSFQIEEKNWGRYLILVKDLLSGHVTGKVLFIESPDWMSRALEDNPTEAAMLSLNLDKPKYQVGDMVRVKIPSSAGGRALISLESGTKTLKSFWIETKAGQTTYAFTATRDMSPNVYVHVTLLQGTQKANDLPLRMYGILPLFVENPETILKPIIAVASSLRPESSAELIVSEAVGKEMTYTLALVDEGLLDITGFETPNPHETFYSRESLGVKTFDLYDDVLAPWGGIMERVLSIGGDTEADKNTIALNKKDPVNQVNRFKPIVIYLGPFHLNSGEKRIHHINIPQYIGALRVMVIAGHNKAYGNAEASVKIKKPLMLLATLPRVLAPEEEVDIPVSVFGMETYIKNATVTIAPSEYFDLLGSQTQIVQFPKPGDQLAVFKIKLKNKTGVAKVTVTARSGKEVSSYTLNLAVRNPNPYITKVYPLTTSAGQSASVKFSSIGSPDMASGYLEVSSIPPINLQKRLSYLVDYPHGCAEQVTSSAFPQLFLTQLGDLSARQKADIEFNVKTSIRKLFFFQNPSGGISYWPGLLESDEWISSYSGHFLLEAQKKGYIIPDGFLTNWKRYQKNLALSWAPRKDNFPGGDLIQAYRLYTLALAHMPELGAMNRLLSFKYLSDAARWRLAAAYGLTGNKDIGLKLIRSSSLQTKPYREYFYTYGSDFRDQSMKLETLIILGDREKAKLVLDELSSNLSSDNWLSTQETAYSLIAIAGYCGTNPSPDRLHYKYTVNGVTKEVISSSYISSNVLAYEIQNADFKLQNLNNNLIYIRIIEKGKPETGQIPILQNNPGKLILDIKYTSLSGKLVDPTRLSQGSDFIATVQLKNTGKSGDYQNMALTEIFPSGWEILNSRLVQNPEGASGAEANLTIPTYQDIRDDRVLTYFNLSPNLPATFQVYLNASYAGHFYAPGMYCEAMYDASIHSGSSGRWVNILPAISKP